MSDPLITLGGIELFGVEASTGVEFIVPSNGLDWSSSPDATIDVQQRPYGDGGWAGEAFLASNPYALSVYIVGPTRSAVEGALVRLTAAASLSATVLSVAEESFTRWASVRRAGRPEVSWLGDKAAAWTVDLVALDPRKFGADLVGSTSLPSSTGGLMVPFTVPFTIDATTVTGQVSLTNPGTVAGPVWLRIDGPVTAPVVTHVSSGQVLRFASSLSLASGEFVTVDMDRHRVLAQGQASRNGWVTDRGWSALEPGDNVWSFAASSYSAGALLTVTARPAWE